MGEFQWWVEELRAGAWAAGVFLRQGDSARDRTVREPGGASSWGITELLRFGGERADRAPALVRARRLDTERREMLLIICMKCADLSGLVMDLPRADFLEGYRIMMENLKQGERGNSWREQTTPTTREEATNYFAHQAGFLEHVVLPMFDTLTLFTSGRFREESAGVGERELGGLAKRARSMAMTRAKMQREAALTRHSCGCCAGFLDGRGVHHKPRRSVAVKDDERDGGRVPREREPVRRRRRWTISALRFVFQGADRARLRVPRGVLPPRLADRRRPVQRVVARRSSTSSSWFRLSLGYSMNAYARRRQVDDLAGMFDIVGDPFVRKSAAQLYLNGVGVTRITTS